MKRSELKEVLRPMVAKYLLESWSQIADFLMKVLADAKGKEVVITASGQKFLLSPTMSFFGQDGVYALRIPQTVHATTFVPYRKITDLEVGGKKQKIGEASTSGGAGAYNTKYAFSGGDDSHRKDIATKVGMKLAPAKRDARDMNEQFVNIRKLGAQLIEYLVKMENKNGKTL